MMMMTKQKKKKKLRAGWKVFRKLNGNNLSQRLYIIQINVVSNACIWLADNVQVYEKKNVIFLFRNFHFKLAVPQWQWCLSCVEPNKCAHIYVVITMPIHVIIALCLSVREQRLKWRETNSPSPRPNDTAPHIQWFILFRIYYSHERNK